MLRRHAVRRIAACAMAAQAWMARATTGAAGRPLAMHLSDRQAQADAPPPMLVSYYERHGALVGGTAFGWDGTGTPRVMTPRVGSETTADVLQLAVSKDAWYAVTRDGQLLRWRDPSGAGAERLRRGVARIAAGASGWIAIDTDGRAWQAGTDDRAQPVMADVIDACVGDSADYLVTADGRVHVRGLAHRGQYGDGRLTASPDYVATAAEAVAVRAHTGHGVHLRRDGTVMGTGGNRFGPLSSHGLGDKADRWGPIFSGAAAVATGSKHTLAIRNDGSLWAWGAGFAIEPARLMDGVQAVGAGDEVSLALDAAGDLWQWDAGRGPRRVPWPAR